MLRALSGTLSNSSSVVRLHEIGIDKTPRAQESVGNMLAAMRMLALPDAFDFSVTKMQMRIASRSVRRWPWQMQPSMRTSNELLAPAALAEDHMPQVHPG